MPSLTTTLNDFDRKLAAIRHTYPAWNVRRRAGGTWIAVRITPPTQVQLEAGLQHFVARDSLDDLIEALGDQLLIAQIGITADPRAALRTSPGTS